MSKIAFTPTTTNASATAELPRPHLTLKPSKAGYPSEGGELDLLVNHGVDLPSQHIDRKPMALALVLDRSGSMSGGPLEAAKAAACAAVEMLLPDDWVSIVAFDNDVEVVAPLTTAGTNRERIGAAVKAIQTHGSTALYAGWAEGISQVMTCPVADASARVVLLSDGQANVGVKDAPTIATDVGEATTHGVTTTTMGFGRSYDENLLRAMADAGQGNYVFIEDESQVAEAFQHELSGLSALRGKNVRLEPSAGVVLSSSVAGRLAQHGTGVRLPDLVAGLERDLMVHATFAAGATEPAVSLVWTDLLSSKEERLSVPLGLAPLPRTEFDALPTDTRVATQLALARIADLKFALSDAFRNRPGEAAVLIEQLAAAVAALPEGTDRTTEQQELNRLRDLASTNESAIAARYSEKFARDRTYGASDVKRSAQFFRERELHDMKVQEYEGTKNWNADLAGSRPAAPSPRSPLSQVTLAGPTGPVNVTVILDDITTQEVDVLVNSTNRNLFGNAGVDGAVHRRGGPQLTRAARQLGGLDYGQAAFTPGFQLPARYVVHTVAMPWQGGNAGELLVLEQAFRSAFAVASKLGARSIAVAAIGTGSYGVPPHAAAGVAVAELRAAVKNGAPFVDARFVILDASVAKAFATELATARAGVGAGQVN